MMGYPPIRDRTYAANAPDLHAAAPRIEEALGVLRAGFSVLTDLSALDSMAIECAESLGHIMDRFRHHGVALVVRVIPDRDKDIGFNILSIIHLRRGVRVVTCATLAEAEAALR